MSDKPIVIVVHGMGKYTPGSFKAEFIKAANTALQRYKEYAEDNIENHVTIEEINYDKFFDEMRQKMADNAMPIAQRLQTISALSGLSWGPDLVLKLASIESKFSEDKFLYTHLLDVFFYASLLGGKVRADAAKQISGIIANNPEKDIHIVAHSLGTAVVHDTLALLYTGQFDANDDIPDLDVVTHKLKSVWMVANVSRLVDSVTGLSDPYKSTVKPTPQGCTTWLNNVRHELDPFTWLAQFDPKDDGSWIPKEFYDNAYQCIETSVITNLNTHSFSQYIQNPRVAVPLLRRIMEFSADTSEIDAVLNTYQAKDLTGAFDELKDALANVKVSDTATIKEFISVAIEFMNEVKELQSQVEAIQ